MNELFKGYVTLKEGTKIPSESIKDKTKFLTLDQVKNFDNYGGVLKDNIVMIDVDDQQQAEILNNILDSSNIECYKIKTTRGIHFYFENNGTFKNNAIKAKTAIGIEVDVKLGSKNTVAPLRISGKKRELIKSNTISTVPFFLKLIKNKNINFLNLQEGNRNNTLFTYILTLQSLSFSKEEITSIIKIINKFVFKNSLDDKEIETILRDEVFNKVSFYNERGQVVYKNFGTFLIREENIIKIDEVLHIYKDGIYITDKKEIERAIIKHLDNTTKQKRNEIISYIDLEIKENKTPAAAQFICVQNGIYDYKNNILLDHTPGKIFKNKLNVNYNPAAKCADVDRALKEFCCGDPSMVDLLQEMIGYIFLRENKFHKSFILEGDGANGKSTFLKMVENLVGPTNISFLSLAELGEKFTNAQLFGKLVNLGDDIPAKFIEDNSIFKKVAAGNSITVQNKGAAPFDFICNTKLIFTTNQMPRINDTTSGLYRRLIIIPFEADFRAENGAQDVNILDKLSTDQAKEHLFNLALEGLKRLLKNNSFSKCRRSEKEKEEFKKINDPILAFLEDYGSIENKGTKDVFCAFGVWCIENNIKNTIHQNGFTKNVCKCGYQTKKISQGNQKFNIYKEK